MSYESQATGCWAGQVLAALRKWPKQAILELRLPAAGLGKSREMGETGNPESRWAELV